MLYSVNKNIAIKNQHNFKDHTLSLSNKTDWRIPLGRYHQLENIKTGNFLLILVWRLKTGHHNIEQYSSLNLTRDVYKDNKEQLLFLN